MPPIDEFGLPAGYRLKPDLELSPRETAARLERGEVVLIDCRREDERRIASIAGSIHVPLDRLGEWIEEAREAETNSETSIVVHCHHGVRSMQAVGLLQHAGFEHARSMAGGIDLWSVAVDPSIPRY